MAKKKQEPPARPREIFHVEVTSILARLFRLHCEEQLRKLRQEVEPAMWHWLQLTEKQREGVRTEFRRIVAQSKSNALKAE